MSEFVWTENTRPDRPGIWKRKNMRLYEVHPEDLTSRWAVGTWAFICDLPDIKDPPEYREVNQGDVGREIEVWDYEGDEIEKRELLAVMPEEVEYRFAVRRPDARDEWEAWNHARILDDGRPKREPREFYVTVDLEDGDIEIYHTKEVAESPAMPGESFEVVHVREVL